MTSWIRESRGGQGILAVLLLLVLAIRVAIPTGYMPTHAPQGIVISVCTSGGAQTAFLPTGTDDGKTDRHGAADGPCMFASGLGGGLLNPIFAGPFALIAAIWGWPKSPALDQMPSRRLAAPPPPAIGPPVKV